MTQNNIKQSSKYIEYNQRMFTKGEVDLSWDKKAIQEFKDTFLEEKRFKFSDLDHRLNYMFFERDYYDLSLLDIYTLEEIKEVFEYAEANAHLYEYKSFMAINKFYESYSVKGREQDLGLLMEDIEHRVAINALFFAEGDVPTAKRMVKLILTQFQPATPTFSNAGLRYSGELVSCFILSIGDSLNDINMAESTGKHLSKIGGGVGYVLDDIRASGEEVNKFPGAAKGPVPVAKGLDYAFRYADQGGLRPGAAVAYLSVMHADIDKFLDSKKISGDEDSRLVTLSIGVKKPDIFMEFAKNQEDYYTFYPKNLMDERGLRMSEIEWTMDFYEDLVNDPKIKKRKLNAGRIDQTCAIVSVESGYPFMFHEDVINRTNPMKPLGNVLSSNLCTEILQTMHVSEYNDYGKEDKIGLDVSCNLGSIMMDKMIEDVNNIEENIYLAIKALTKVSTSTSIDNAPGVKRANNKMRSVGLGLMNAHGASVKYGFKYTSDENKDLMSVTGYLLNYYSLKASNRLAKEIGAFEYFDKSTYADGSFFDESPIGKPVEFKTEAVKEIFDKLGFKFPSQEEIDQLKKDVMEYGIANAYRLAVAPTGNISYVRDATPAVSPIVSKVIKRMAGSFTINYPMPYLEGTGWWTYQEASNMKLFDIIDVVAELQKNIDQGISLELPMNIKLSTRQRIRVYHYAHHKGLKTLYYARPLDDSVCVSCSV